VGKMQISPGNLGVIVAPKDCLKFQNFQGGDDHDIEMPQESLEIGVGKCDHGRIRGIERTSIAPCQRT